jgi:hypothetical protein
VGLDAGLFCANPKSSPVKVPVCLSPDGEKLTVTFRRSGCETDWVLALGKTALSAAKGE